MHSHCIYIFDEADGDHLVFRIANYFKHQLFPAQYGFLDEHLADQAGGYATACYCAQFLHIVDQTTARAAHCIGRPHHDGVAQFRCHPLCILNGIDSLTFRHIYPQSIHRLLEGNAVLAAAYGIDVHADHLHAVLLKYSVVCQFGAEIESRLAA